MSLEYSEDELAAVLAALAYQKSMLEVTRQQSDQPTLHEVIFDATRTALEKAEREYNEHWGVLR